MKVLDNPNLSYNNGIILNEDAKAYHEYISTRTRAMKQQEINLGMKDRINSLEEELSQMKDILSRLLKDKGI